MSLFIVALVSFGASGRVLDHATSSGREALSGFSGDFFGSETARFAHLVRSETVFCEFDYSVARFVEQHGESAPHGHHAQACPRVLRSIATAAKATSSASQHSRANPSN